MIGDVEKAKVEENPDVYLIRYSNEKVRINEASITIRKSDLRPIERSFVFTYAGKTYSLTFTMLKIA